MVTKKPPKEPDNPITDKCDVIIHGIRRTILKINDWSHIELHNEEFRNSKKKKIKENLDQYLLTPDVIKDFVQQIREEDMWFERVSSELPTRKVYGCYPITDKRNGKDFLIIFSLDDELSEFIEVITAFPFPLERFEKKRNSLANPLS